VTDKPEVIRLRRKVALRFYERLAGDSWRDQGLRSLRRSVFTLPASTRTMSSVAVSAMATLVALKFNQHCPAGDIKLRQHHAHRTSESSDMLLYLAGVNEHAVLRSVGSKRWSVAHFLRTIQYLFEYGLRFLAT
jgi:hypothetical protein